MRASHILVKDEDSAKQIIQKIKQGESFEELAQKYSECPSKEKGGDLGNFSKGMMVKPFEEATLNLEVGALTQTPVKTQFGYHIIKRTA